MGPMTDLKLSVVLAGESPKSIKFGLSEMTELLAKSILLRAYTLVLSSGNILRLITLLKMGVGYPCTAGNRLMEASSGSKFLASRRTMDRLGLTIYCVPVRVEESEVLMQFGLWRVNLAVATEVLTSCSMDPPLPVRLTYLGVRKMRAPLRAASVMIYFWSTVWRAPKVSWITGTSSVTSWSIRRIAPWMIFGMNRFFNNF